jgi:EmrB/QacA subfamily drug resistance transporter
MMSWFRVWPVQIGLSVLGHLAYQLAHSRGPGPGVGARGRWGSLLVCSTAMFMVMIDGSIVNVALPTIGHDMGASTAGLQWVVDGYLLVLACGLLSAGAAGDRLGRRRVLRIGLVVFGVGSVAASVAPNVAALIGFRMLQGLGAAMLPPTSLSLVAGAFPDPKQRAAAMGAWGAISGLAVASGPVIGGMLVAAAGWRAIFWVNVPVVAIALGLTRRYVAESAAPRPRRLDLPGQALVIVGLGALTYAVIAAPQRGWASPTTLAVFGGAVAALAAFLLVEHYRDEPMLSVSLFADPVFSGATAVAALVYFALNGFTFLTSLYLQDVRGDSPLVTGLSLLPASAVIMIAAPLSARLTARYGPRLPVLAAAAAMTAGLVLLTRVGDRPGFAVLAVAYLGVGIGVGLVNPPLTTTAVSAMGPEQAGVAAAVTGTVRQVGGVLGVALLGSLLTSDPHTAPITGRLEFTQASHVGYAIAATAVALAALIGLCTLPPRRRKPGCGRAQPAPPPCPACPGEFSSPLGGGPGRPCWPKPPPAHPAQLRPARGV